MNKYQNVADDSHGAPLTSFLIELLTEEATK